MEQKTKSVWLSAILIAGGLIGGYAAYRLIYSPGDGLDAGMVSRILFVVNCVSTFYMVGLIWIVQCVNYPLFARVGIDQFSDFHQRHVGRVTAVVAGPMFLEAVTALLMLFYPRPGIPRNLLGLGMILIFVIWISTLILQVPLHNRLSRGFNAQAARRMVSTNWVRTVAWTLRGGLMSYLMFVSLQ